MTGLSTRRTTWAHRKLEAHERNTRTKKWLHFGMTRRGRMSWADWFTGRVECRI